MTTTPGRPVATCPTCHTPVERGDIYLQAMKQCKTNLSVMIGR
jgi:endogenous inhibitor of DNA gyrase (YacG/DUF329 family)